jgi:hypothetical protein
MSHADAFEHDDATYVMGLLSDAERAAFEAHLTTCDACAERVRQLAATVDLLAGISLDDLLAFDVDDSADPPRADGGPMPDTLLPGLLRSAGVTRRRQRWVTAGVTGLAAACLIALLVVVWPSASTPKTTHPQAMSALVATPLRATAAISHTEWGTRISLDCNYRYAPAGTARFSYQLIVVATDGTRHNLGSWTVAVGVHTKFTSGTALSDSAIRSVQVTSSDGTPLLSLDV